jgi:cation transporter-like permease
MSKVKKIVLASLLLAVFIVLEYVIAFEAQSLRFSFGTFTVLLFARLFLTSLWFAVMYKSVFIAFFSARAGIAAIFLPINGGHNVFPEKVFEPDGNKIHGAGC